MHAPKITSINKNFQPNKSPMPSRRFALSAKSGSPASNVPAGQMYLQNAGAPTPSCHQKYTGKRSRKITATAYFNRLSFCVKAFLRSLGEGILYNKSCTSPPQGCFAASLWGRHQARRGTNSSLIPARIRFWAASARYAR